MIPLSSATRVFVVTGATDMRKGFDGLYGIVVECDPVARQMTAGTPTDPLRPQAFGGLG